MKHKFTFFAVMMMALAMPLQAQNYDFSAVAPSGQTLYYGITPNGVQVIRHPDYTTITGGLTIPAMVTDSAGISYNVTAVGDYAFTGFPLTSVTISTGISSIGNLAFKGCPSLVNVMLPDSLVFIGGEAFQGCPITSITIPRTVTSIGSSAFKNCTSLTTVNFNADSCYAPASSMSAIFAYSGITNLNIGSTVRRIPGDAFAFCYNLTNVIFPNSLTYIGEYSFWADTLLTSVVIPDSVRTIADGAFYYCTGLANLVIGSGVDSIGMEAFVGDTNISSIELRGSVPPALDIDITDTMFGDYHFYDYNWPFKGIDSSITVTVPCGSGEAYRAAEGWSNFTNIVELCDTLPCDTVELPYFSDFSQCWTATGGATIIDSAHASIVSQGQKITSPWMNASAGTCFFRYNTIRFDDPEYSPDEQITVRFEAEDGTNVYSTQGWPWGSNGSVSTNSGCFQHAGGLIRVTFEYSGNTPVPTLKVVDFAFCNYEIALTMSGPTTAYIGDTITVTAHATLPNNDTATYWDWNFYDRNWNFIYGDDSRIAIVGMTDSSRTFVVNDLGEFIVESRVSKYFFSNDHDNAVEAYSYQNIHFTILDTTPCESLSLPYSADFSHCWTAEGGASIASHNQASIPNHGNRLISPWLESEPGATFINFRVIRDYDSSWYVEDRNEAIRFSLIVQHEDGTILDSGWYRSDASTDYLAYSFRSPGGRIRIIIAHTDNRPADLLDISDLDIFQYPLELSINAPGIAHVGDTVTVSMNASCAPGESIDYSYMEYYAPNGDDILNGTPYATILSWNDTSCTLVFNGTGYYTVYVAAGKLGLYHNNGVTLTDYQNIRVVDFDFCVEDSIYYTSAAKDTVFGCHPKIHNAVLPGSARFIQDYAMGGLENLKSVTIADGLTEIGHGAFGNNYKLSTVVLPSTITHIRRYAFGRCTALERIDLPQSLTALDEGAFWYCTALDSLVFPDHIRTLGRNLMDSCISLTYVHLPDSLEYADTSLLRFCTALRHVDLPQHINRIEGWALMQCHSLESLDVPEGVTSIGETALYNDFNLSKLRLPSTLRSLGNIAMAYCQSLDTIWVAATTPPACTQNTFSYANGSATLVVPCGTAESYRSTLWSYFNIVEDCGTEGIGDVEPMWAVIAIQNGAIVVEGAEDHPVSVYDINGRLLATAHGEHAPLQFNVPASGTYLVKVGDHPARRVVVVR